MKVLFVGDLRTAFNYGAIATSDILLGMVKEVTGAGDHQLEVIDHRSFIHETPVQGFGEWSAPKYARRKWGRRLLGAVRMGMIEFLRAYPALYYKLRGEKAPQRGIHVPSRFCEYDLWVNDVLAGKRLAYERRLIEWADIVVFNSEGNVVNGIDQWGRYKEGPRYILFLEYLAKKMGKKAAVINHTVDPDSEDGIEMVQHVYPMMDYVSVREPLSVGKLEEFGVKRKVAYIPDALFSYVPEPNWEPSEELKSIIDFSKPYICLGDSSGISSLASTVKWDLYYVFSDLIAELRKICPQVVVVDGFSGGLRELNELVKQEKLPCVNLHNCPYEDLIEVLGRAKCFVSGRWHASIMGLLSGTPFILWGSDSHKTKSLSVIYDYPFRFYNVHTLPLHIKDMAADVKRAIEQEPALREQNMKTTLQLRERAMKNTYILKEWLSE